MNDADTQQRSSYQTARVSLRSVPGTDRVVATRGFIRRVGPLLDRRVAYLRKRAYARTPVSTATRARMLYGYSSAVIAPSDLTLWKTSLHGGWAAPSGGSVSASNGRWPSTASPTASAADLRRRPPEQAQKAVAKLFDVQELGRRYKGLGLR